LRGRALAERRGFSINDHKGAWTSEHTLLEGKRPDERRFQYLRTSTLHIIGTRVWKGRIRPGVQRKKSVRSSLHILLRREFADEAKGNRMSL